LAEDGGMSGAPGFFDVDERLQRLSDLGDQLEAFTAAIDFEVFRPELETALAYSDGAKGGRPPFDPVMMFKVLVIQTVNTLSDERTEYLINDRLSFMRFLGLGLSDRVPDSRTIWPFRERLTKAGAIGPLFARFDATLRGAGYIATSGQIVDATLVQAPRQRNTQAEKADIKTGRVPEEWTRKPAKLRHKDRDARWTVKFTKAKPREDGTMPAVDLAIPTLSQPHRHRPALRLDPHMARHRRGRARGQPIARRRRRSVPGPTACAAGQGGTRGLLDKTNTASAVWGDTAYRSATNEAFMAENGFVSRIQRKQPANRPMSRTVRRANNAKSEIRAGVEHVFAEQKDRMDLFIRTIGLPAPRSRSASPISSTISRG